MCGVEVALREGIGFRELFSQGFCVGQARVGEDLLVREAGDEVGLLTVYGLQPETVKHVKSVCLLQQINLLHHLFRGQGGRVGGLCSVSRSVSCCEGHEVVALQCSVEFEICFGVPGHFLPRHHGEDACLSSRDPRCRSDFKDIRRKEHDAG